MSRIVIAAYRPKPGQQVALDHLMRRHHLRLLAEGLVTNRAPMLMHASDGVVVEVFEWVSPAAINAAHDNVAVQAMWDEYARVSDYIPLAEITEARDLFAEFEPFAPAAELHPELSP
jgi:hypothetical protein